MSTIAERPSNFDARSVMASQVQDIMQRKIDTLCANLLHTAIYAMHRPIGRSAKPVRLSGSIKDDHRLSEMQQAFSSDPLPLNHRESLPPPTLILN